jgi:hypothetical protein
MRWKSVKMVGTDMTRVDENGMPRQGALDFNPWSCVVHLGARTLAVLCS